MERRHFVRLLGGAALGGIFVPKFGRWFRPNLIWQPPPLTLYDLTRNRFENVAKFGRDKVREIIEADLREYNHRVTETLAQMYA